MRQFWTSDLVIAIVGNAASLPVQDSNVISFCCNVSCVLRRDFGQVLVDNRGKEKASACGWHHLSIYNLSIDQ